MCWHELQTVGVRRLSHGKDVEVRLSDPRHLKLNNCNSELLSRQGLTALLPRFLTLHSRMTVLPMVVYTMDLLVLTKYGGDSVSISL